MPKTVQKTTFAPNPKGLLNFYVRLNLSSCVSLTVALNWSGSQRDGGNNMPQPLPKSLYVSSWYEAKCQTWKWFKRLMMHVTSYRDSHTHTQTPGSKSLSVKSCLERGKCWTWFQKIHWEHLFVWDSITMAGNCGGSCPPYKVLSCHPYAQSAQPNPPLLQILPS